MPNMSYCRFQNTVMDLEDCKDTLENQGVTGENEYGEHLSREEFESALRLIEMCREITEQFEDVDMDELREEYRENIKNSD